jgi:hypothetical protein
MPMNADYLNNEDIWRQADAFRNSPMLIGHNSPPLDVMYIVDVLLRFDVIEIDGMFDDLRMDAAIVPAEKTLYVDRNSLDKWERKNHWIERRLRFTLAHELGHFTLHQDYLAGIHFSDIAEFKLWMLAHRKNKRAEDQADEFAGRFLIPSDVLLAEYSAYSGKMGAADPAWHSVGGMREHIAQKIAPRFGVNPQVIETRFDHEGVWPAE